MPSCLILGKAEQWLRMITSYLEETFLSIQEELWVELWVVIPGITLKEPIKALGGLVF